MPLVPRRCPSLMLHHISRGGLVMPGGVLVARWTAATAASAAAVVETVDCGCLQDLLSLEKKNF